MKKRFFMITALAAFSLITVARLHAQSGCEDSPENPTAILALVGSAGIFAQHLHRRHKK